MESVLSVSQISLQVVTILIAVYLFRISKRKHALYAIMALGLMLIEDLLFLLNAPIVFVLLSALSSHIIWFLVIVVPKKK